MRSDSVRLRAIGVALVLAAMTFAMTGCSQQTNPAPSTTTTSTPAGPRVIFPDGYAVTVEIAADDPTREQGLMFRDRLAEDRGMLFIFTQSGDYPFWMKNTLIPLDMLWIDEKGQVVHASYDVQPCKADPCPNYPPNAIAKYVLEVAGGVARVHHIQTGSVLRLEGLEKVIVR